PSGPLPPQGAARQIRLDVARGETEDAQIVVTHAKSITAAVEGGGLQPLTTRLLFAHFVRFGSKLVPDALMPWGGAARAAEYPNQPIWLQVSVPENTRPGTDKGQVTLTLDGKQ